jgi:hypothetical protein
LNAPRSALERSGNRPPEHGFRKDMNSMNNSEQA